MFNTLSQNMILAFVLFTTMCFRAKALDNGLALTPPMGWLSWLRFGCDTDCVKHPLTCISERLLMDMADRMVEDGYKEAGYEYVNVDDCWLANRRDAHGRLQPDPKRFPHGIKWLTDYIHSKGLKFGIYEDYGTKTCAGYPGSLDHIETDAQTFADWGVDYVKFDGCNIDPKMLDIGYPEMSRALNKTGRQMVFSCEWAYLTQYYLHEKANYTANKEFCNVWRVWYDIGSDWKSIQSTIDYFDNHQDELIKANGPGGFNDPDMVSVGNPSLTVDQAKAQFAMWAMWSAVLLMSNDLRFIAPPFTKILLNKKVIAINQDPMGTMGRLVVNTTYVGVYVKPITPVKDSSNPSYAVAFLNRNLKDKAEVTVRKIGKLGLINAAGYDVEDLYSGEKFGVLYPSSRFSVTVNSTGIVLIKATVI